MDRTGLCTLVASIVIACTPGADSMDAERPGYRPGPVPGIWYAENVPTREQAALMREAGYLRTAGELAECLDVTLPAGTDPQRRGYLHVDPTVTETTATLTGYGVRIAAPEEAAREKRDCLSAR